MIRGALARRSSCPSDLPNLARPHAAALPLASCGKTGAAPLSTLFADLGVNPPFGFDVTLKYGNHRLDNPASLSGGGYVSVFNDWSVNLSRPWLGIDLNLSYSGTSLTGSDCSAYSGHNSYCDTTFMLKASRPFF